MFGRIVSRRNLTPPHPIAAQDAHGTRRQSGARREASDRVRLIGPNGEIEGWTLNVSRGGVRIIVEDRVELGNEYDIVVGDEDLVRRPCRVVWVQEEADGQIAGVQYLDTNTGPPPGPSGAPPAASGAPSSDSGE
jgi:PilZ domain